MFTAFFDERSESDSDQLRVHSVSRLLQRARWPVGPATAICLASVTFMETIRTRSRLIFTKSSQDWPPAALYSNSPVHDSNFEIEGVRKAFAKAEDVFTMLNAKDRLKLATPDAQHDFPEAQRLEAYQWLERQLKK